MPEPIYHVTALYCGEPRLMFAGFASRVAKKLRMLPNRLHSGEYLGYVFDCAKDRWGNALPYTLWSGPVVIAEYIPSTKVVEYEEKKVA